MGSGGYATFSINYNNDTSCLNILSPSSTLGPPAGSYSTIAGASSTGNSNSNASSGSSNRNGTRTATLIGGIVGGVVGGLLILAIGALCYYLQKKKIENTANAKPGFLFIAVQPRAICGYEAHQRECFQVGNRSFFYYPTVQFEVE